MTIDNVPVKLPNHTCHARECDVQVVPALFMCYHHWRRIPAKMKEAVRRAYRPGQEIDKQPSAAYLAAADAAIQAVWEGEVGHRVQS